LLNADIAQIQAMKEKAYGCLVEMAYGSVCPVLKLLELRKQGVSQNES
jgi:hypothetical protein